MKQPTPIITIGRFGYAGLTKLRTTKASLAEKLGIGTILLSSLWLYGAGLSQSGYANSYYAAAVQAASVSWKALFFGSLDGASFVTVDKPPFAIWFMGLSARLFGFSSFSMLLPSALAGVATIWLVYALVKRIAGLKSAYVAAVFLMLTPVAALMFRFNNPDSFLTLFLAASGYTFVRALENRRAVLWLCLTAVLTGCAFNTKMLQGLIVLPAMAIAYLFFARPKWLTRLWHLVVAGIVTAVSSLWWAVVVWLVPAGSRPYIGSSSSNSIWDLILGYNGLGRLLGGSRGQAGGGGGIQAMAGGGGFGPGGSGFGGSTGILRMFNTDFGPNIGWFIPLALLSAGFSFWLLRRTRRGGVQRPAIVMLLGWAIIHIIVFSMTSGTIHPYYPIVMAPAIAALIGIALPYLWQAFKDRTVAAWVLPLGVMVTTLTSYVLLGYNNDWPWLKIAVIVAGIISAIAMVAYWRLSDNQWLRRGAVTLGAFAVLAGPTMFTISTAQAAHTGSIPTSGPSATAGVTNNESAQADSSLVAYLLSNRGGATWLVAVASANESAPLQITSGQPVMAVGGFNGSDSTLTLDQFKALVAAGKLQYYAVSSSGRGGGRGGNSDILDWVKANGASVDYGGTGTALYKLSV